MPVLTILHTNDRHGRWSPETIERIAFEKARSQPAILLDAGDAIRAGNVGISLFGEPVLEAMGRAGYDAMAVGNREFHFRPQWFHQKIAQASFPVLSANCYRSDGLPVEGVRPFVILKAGDLRAAILGLTVPMITQGMWACLISPFRFEDPIESAQKWAPKLRQEADVVVALTHLGSQWDRQLAQEVPDIDLIVGGHSHTWLETPERVGDTAIAQAGCRDRFLGRVELKVAGGAILSVKGCLIPWKQANRSPTSPG